MKRPAFQHGLHGLNARAGKKRRGLMHVREEGIVLGTKAVEAQIGGRALTASDRLGRLYSLYVRESVGCKELGESSRAGFYDRYSRDIEPAKHRQQRHRQIVATRLERVFVTKTV
jgi:hypothetical protein